MESDLERGERSSNLPDLSTRASRQPSIESLVTDNTGTLTIWSNNINRLPYIEPKRLKLSSPSEKYYEISYYEDNPKLREVDLRQRGPIRIENTQYSVEQAVLALNYGQNPLYSRLSSLRDSRSDVLELYNVWNASLLSDLLKKIFPGSSIRDLIQEEVNLFSPSFEHLRFAREVYTALKTIEILGSLHLYESRVHTKQCAFPLSYYVVDLLGFIQYLRQAVKKTDAHEKGLSIDGYSTRARQFWMDMFHQTDSAFDFKEEEWHKPDERFDQILEFMGLCPLQSTSGTKLRSKDFNLLRREGPDSSKSARAALARKLLMDANGVPDVRTQVLSAVGITEQEIKKASYQGPLEELKASVFGRGPFRITLTSRTYEHLTFTRCHSALTVRLLDLESIFKLYVLQCTGIISAAGAPTLFVELLNSHVLFFGRDSTSQALGQRHFYSQEDMDLLIQFREYYSPIRTELLLQDFPIYGSRLKSIQSKMNDWRPETIQQLSVRPYNDPLGFYAFWFGTFVFVAGIMALGIGIAQTYAAFKQLQLQLQQQ